MHAVRSSTNAAALVPAVVEVASCGERIVGLQVKAGQKSTADRCLPQVRRNAFVSGSDAPQ